MNNSEIQQKAQKLLLDAGCQGIFPVPVERIANFLGFDCYYFTPDSTTQNILGALNHKIRKIYINPDESPKSQQFTAAHEIGHIVLHPMNEDHIDYRRTNSILDKKELETDFFAMNLLMPSDIFIYQWQKLNKNLNDLSDFFGVNVPAIALRVSSLNLE